MRGLLADEAAWYVTDDGRQVTYEVNAEVVAFAACHRALHCDALLRAVRRHFLFFGTRTERPRLCSRTIHRRWRASTPRITQALERNYQRDLTTDHL